MSMLNFFQNIIPPAKTGGITGSRYFEIPYPACQRIKEACNLLQTREI